MRRKKRPFWLLVFGLLTLAGLLYVIFKFAPTEQLSTLPALPAGRNFQFSTAYVFFLLFFTVFFSLTAFFFNNIRRGIVWGLLITTYLFLRFIGLTQVLFLLLLIAIALILELVFHHQR